MTSLRWPDLLIVAGYLLGVLVIGYRMSRKQTSTEEYFVAKRSIPAWAMGISIVATIITSISFIAYPGNAFSGDWAELVPGFMVVVVLAIAGFIVIPFFRRTVRMSAFEYFQRRFGVSVRLYTALGFAAGHFSKLGFVFYLVALTIRSLTGWDMTFVIAGAGAVTIVYTCAGGVAAVIWNDVVQGAILLAGITVSLICLHRAIPGGAAAGLSLAWNAHKLSLGSLAPSLSQKTVWVMVIYGLFWYLQRYTVDQTIVQRYLVAKTDRAAIRGVGMGVLLCIPVWALFLLIGSLTWAFFTLTKEAVPASITQPDQYYPYFLATHVPVGFAGIVVAALLSSAMSGISSDLNGLAVVGVEDFYRRIRPHASDAERLAAGRICVVVTGLFCVLVALLLSHTRGSALPLYFLATSLLAGGLFGIFFLAFFCPRATQAGVWYGIVANLVFAVYATSTSGTHPSLDLGHWNYSLHPLLVGAIGHVIVVAVGYTMSRLLSPAQKPSLALTYWARSEAALSGSE